MSHLDDAVVAPARHHEFTPDVSVPPPPPAAPRPPARARLRELLGPALFEASFVVLGVVLAYAVNEWREAREHRRRADAATSAITAEIQSNRDAALASAAYHQTLLDSVRAAVRSGAAPPTLLAFSRGFVMPAQLSSTAWETAAEAGVMEHIPYPVVLRLSRVYAQQARYERQAMSAGELIYGELYRGGTDGIVANYRNLGHLIRALQYQERHMAALYDSTLAAVPHQEPR